MEPVIRSTAGQPSEGPRSASSSTESRIRLALTSSSAMNQSDLGDQDDLPAHPTIITCGLNSAGNVPVRQHLITAATAWRALTQPGSRVLLGASRVLLVMAAVL